MNGSFQEDVSRRGWYNALFWITPLIAGGCAAALSYWVSDFRLLLLTGWIAYGVLALSLAFVWGRSGIFSFGQPAFFGVGAYFYGILAINYGGVTGETLTPLAAAAMGGALFAAVLGYFMFYGRVADVYVGIVTLAVTLVLLTVIGATSSPKYRVGEALIGGYNGLRPLPKITVPGGSSRGLSIQQGYWFMVAVATGLYLLSLLITRRPIGRIFAAVRENELRAELLGYDVRWRKLQAFTIGGALAGLAGGLFGAWAGVVTPAVFSLSQMALVVIWVLVGGRTSLVGAFIGTLIVQALSNYFGAAGGILSGQTPLILGVIFVLFVLLLPGGLVPSVIALWRRLTRRPTSLATRKEDTFVTLNLPDVDHHSEQAPLAPERKRLEIEGLSKAFGGLEAISSLNIAFEGPNLYCIIGPNGAGKSTLFNLLVGRFPPTSGRILLDGQDISRMAIHKRAQFIGVKLQQPTIFPDLTVRENAWLASYSSRHDADIADGQSLKNLDLVGLLRRAGELARNLSHGEQQWLELSMALAQDPSVILLDEPTAGMTRAETLRVVPVIRKLAARQLVIVIEHDMTFVDRLNAPVIMLHQGKVFAKGRIDELRRNEAVLDIYLGRSQHVAN